MLYAAPLGAGSVILDLGANRGEFASQMSARFGGTYYLVEANPALVDTLRADGRFRVMYAAVGATDGPVRFNIAEHDEASSLLALPATDTRGGALREQVEVPGRSLDSLMTEIGIGRLDVLKMDIEGAEVVVLESLPKARLREIGQIAVEFHGEPAHGYRIGRAVEDVLRALRRDGFFCLDFSGGRRRNVLCINLAMHPIPVLQRLRWTLRTSVPDWLRSPLRVLPRSWKRRLGGVNDDAWG